MFLKVFFNFIKEYGKNHKFKLVLLGIFSVIMGMFEFLGLTLIFPFVMLLSGDTAILNLPNVKLFLNTLNISPNENLILPLSFLIIFIYIVKDILMILFIKFQNNIIANWQYDIFCQTLENLIFAPYPKLSKMPYGDKSVLVYSSLNTALWSFVHKVILLFSNLIVAICILGFLFYKFAVPAFFASLFLFVFITLEHLYFKKKAKIFGLNILNAQTASGNLFEYTMKGIKEIKVSKNREYFINNLKENYNILNTNSKLANSNGQYPLYTTEIGIILSFVILSCLIFILQKTSENFILPSLAIVAAIVLRLVPVLNKLQNTLYLINQSKVMTEWFMKYSSELKKIKEIEPECEDIDFKNKITLENVSYSYDDTPVLKNVNLEIKKGDFIGIVGPSGAGKTTLIDILTGLNILKEGKMKSDGVEITRNNLRAWHRKISILPQDFFLMPSSILENVCFGDMNKDLEKVNQALKKADIFDKIKDINAPADLSHGQKHRIALARAFYQDTEILFLDEATSTLDLETESKVARSIASLKGEKTIIAIAHRLSTLNECDCILYMKDGKIIDKGTFSELKEKHPDFENMLKLSNFNPKI